MSDLPPSAAAPTTLTEGEELEMELALASFAEHLPPDVQMRQTHRVAFRAGWELCVAASRGRAAALPPTERMLDLADHIESQRTIGGSCPLTDDDMLLLVSVLRERTPPKGENG